MIVIIIRMANEKRFMIVGDVPEWMNASYSILNATFHQGELDHSVLLNYGTIIEVYTTENVFQQHALLCDMMEKRYFAFVIEDNRVIDIKTIANFTNHPTPSAYVALPFKDELLVAPPGFYSISYPHLTIVPPTTSISKYSSTIGVYHTYKMSELIPTCNTLAHHVMTSENQTEHLMNHITRAVRHGKKPIITANEIVPGTTYTSTTGYSILM
jgi:hypothetical protein